MARDPIWNRNRDLPACSAVPHPIVFYLAIFQVFVTADKQLIRRDNLSMEHNPLVMSSC